mgnify:CR=1 FL=1
MSCKINPLELCIGHAPNGDDWSEQVWDGLVINRSAQTISVIRGDDIKTISLDDAGLTIELDK